ncbi:MAG: ThiF family adenylyltransferase [Saprospiraceae bacterium]|nr:ThiF family adenylyltransferase [Saprospiraceae bacterium]
MNEQDLNFYNSHFEEIKDINVIQKFSFNHKTKTFDGKIALKREKSDIEFNVNIPEDYPFRDIRFICSSMIGYPHQNYDKSVCLNTPFINHIYSRLELDIEKLKGWVYQYVEQEKSDEHYEYSPAQYGGTVDFLFQEGEYQQERFDQSRFGEMCYSILNTHTSNKKISRISAICQKIGNKEIEWSSSYKKKEKHIGIWVFINQEPVFTRKHRIDNWADLVPLFPEGFLSYFEDFCKRTANYKLGAKTFQDKILLSVGYRIPNHKRKEEIHWDLILLPKNQFPRKQRNSSQKLGNSIQNITWEQSYNSDYQRFFGRGALTNKITNSKILIIGVGALGSSIAEILVRGGIKSLSINDIDIVEAGNICRSIFAFSDVGSSKSAQLKAKLTSISPFVEIDITDNIVPYSPKSEKYEELKTELQKFDIIFDCSANNGIIQMLSDMELKSKVYYLSMTNKAKEMICISNIDCISMIERRNQMLFSLNGIQEAEFREGTGCWHPTFEASYFDINQLLHYTVKKINSSFALNLPQKSFYTYFENEVISSSEDIKFIQKELGLTISIESACLDTIFDLVWQHYPKEFGGIFVGNYINNYKEVVISDVIIPQNFKSSFMGFQPDPNDFNRQLKKIYDKSNGKVVYIGDWHSHPNSNNQFSTPDFQSIKSVAKSSKVNTHNPILMIAAFGKDYFDPGFYVYFQDKLYKYEKIK